MPPGSDVVATRSTGVTAAQRLSSSSGRAPPRITVESGSNKPAEAANLSARERLRAHVHRNLQIQQEAARQASERAQPDDATPAAPSCAATAALLGVKGGGKRGLEKLYGPIEDTRLGVSDISNDQDVLAMCSVPASLLGEPINMSLDAGELHVSEDGELDEPGFDDSDAFLPGPGSDWSGLDTAVHLYYGAGSPGTDAAAKEVVVDDEWVQGIYEMQGMDPDA